MSKISSKYQLNEIVALSVLKRKFKQYMTDANLDGFKSSIFPKYLVVSLVMVLEELLTDCLDHIKKHETTGLYVIDQSMISMVLNKSSKYDVFIKYQKKYNSTIKYQESVMFNYRKVVDGLESKYGDKLMIDADAKNFVSYLLVSLQYELIKLSLVMVVYSNRKTMSAGSLLSCLKFLFEEMYPKIKLKLDSMVQTKDVEADAEGEGEGEDEDIEGEDEDVEGEGEDVEGEGENVEQVEEQVEEDNENTNDSESVEPVKTKKSTSKVQVVDDEHKKSDDDKLVIKKGKQLKKKVVVETKEVMDDDLENDLENELDTIEVDTKTKNKNVKKKVSN